MKRVIVALVIVMGLTVSVPVTMQYQVRTQTVQAVNTGSWLMKFVCWTFAYCASSPDTHPQP